MTISGNSAGYDGGIDNDGMLTMTGGTVDANTAQHRGGGLFIGSGTVNIYGGTIEDNTTGNGAGGGISNGGVLTISGGTISGNNSDGIDNFNKLTITGGTIANNFAEGFGGGIANESGATLTMTAGTISGNGCWFGGGGIENWGTLSVSGGTIEDNTVSAGGGGGISNGGVLTISGGTISGNYSDGGGGIDNVNTLTITGGTVANQLHAVGRGGGIANEYGYATLTMSDGSISGNGSWWGRRAASRTGARSRGYRAVRSRTIPAATGRRHREFFNAATISGDVMISDNNACHLWRRCCKLGRHDDNLWRHN